MVIHHTFCFTLLLIQFVFARGGKDASGGRTDSSQAGVTNDVTPGSVIVATPSITQSDVLHTSTSSSPTLMPSASAQPTSSNVSVEVPPITFVQPSNATTCTPMMLSWQFHPVPFNATDLNEDMQFVVTNINVTQSVSSDASSSNTPSASASLSIHEIISNHIAMSSGTLNWTAVSVPEGWYIIIAYPAYPPQLPVESAKFFVTTGSNISCIDSSFLKSRSALSAGALAGTVMGSVVGLIAVLGAFLLPRLWRRGVPGHKAWADRRGKLYDAF